MAHDLGWPVRVGGPTARNGPEEIELIQALYEDQLVGAALKRNGVPRVEPGGPIWRRFPAQVAVTPELLHELYVDCGLSTRHIELLTGRPAQTVNQLLRKIGIQLRSPGGRTPFLQRWRAGQSSPVRAHLKPPRRSDNARGQR